MNFTVVCESYTVNLYTADEYGVLTRVKRKEFGADNLREETVEDVVKHYIVQCELNPNTTYYYIVEVLKKWINTDGDFPDTYFTTKASGSFTTNKDGADQFGWEDECTNPVYDITLTWDFDSSQILDDGLNVVWYYALNTVDNPIQIQPEIVADEDGVLSYSISLTEVRASRVYVLGRVDSNDYDTATLIDSVALGE